MTDGIRWAASIVGAALLTAYQVPQLYRIWRRKSSEDFSLPAYAMVWLGLLCYVVATSGTPAHLSAIVSLTNVSLLILVILNYRRPRE